LVREIHSSMSEDFSEEEFQMAVEVYAHFLQINKDTEGELMLVAEDALMNLPPGT
jgi:hypothetical protein